MTNQVYFSPNPMQQLASNPGNSDHNSGEILCLRQLGRKELI